MLSFHELYSSYAEDVYRFAYWLAGNASDAEDITSETFVRAWTRIGSIRTETLKAYLLKIARNIYLQQLRKSKRETDLQTVHPDPAPGPERIVTDRDELRDVREIMKILPEIDRAAFILRVQHELPYAEIARVLQISEVAAKVKVHRVRRKILETRLSKETL
jgi:RNA polymerase sigma-70 factor (ECF subfamily)